MTPCSRCNRLVHPAKGAALLAFGLCLAGMASSAEQGGATPLTVRMGSTDVLQGIPIPVDLHNVEMEFTKEPDFAGREAVRGGIPLGTRGVLGFAWDKAERLLYLDLNRNLDLTDDAESPFKAAFSEPGQRFPGLAISLVHDGVTIPYRLDVEFRDLARFGATCSVVVRSGWKGEATVNGAVFRVTLVDNLDGVIDPSDTLFLEGAAPAQPQPIPILARLQFGVEYFDYAFVFDASPSGVDLVATLTPWRPARGQVTLEGKSIAQLELQGPITLELGRPESPLSLPVGIYVVRSIQLDTGQISFPNLQIEVTKDGPNVLRLGGPAKPHITATRAGTVLRLNYDVAGIGGEIYSGGGRRAVGAFAVLKGGKKVGWDQFERG